MKDAVITALALLPKDLANTATKKIWFVSNFEDAWGFVLTGEELGGKHLIFLNNNLFDQSPAQIRYSILHEVGHVILGHRNAILKAQSKTETEKQEDDADKFARQILESK